MNVLFRQLANKIHKKLEFIKYLWEHSYFGIIFIRWGQGSWVGSFEGYFVGSVMEIPLMNIKQMIVIKFVGMLIHGQRLP